jgi:hypothetical protein
MDEIYAEMAQLIFSVLNGTGHKIRMYDEKGTEVFDPAKANRLWSDSEKLMVVLGKTKGSPAKPLVTFCTSDVTDPDIFNDFKTAIKQHNIYDFSFDTEPYSKTLEPRHFKFMNIEESWSGTTKTSYFPIDNVNVVIRHSRPFQREQLDGDGKIQRWRRIKQIMLFTPDGQRFNFPHKYVLGARAMAQHLNQQQSMYDENGNLIQELINLYNNLKSIQSKSKRLEQWDLLTHVQHTKQQIKSLLTAISQQHRYTDGVNGAKNWLTEWKSKKYQSPPTFKEVRELDEWFNRFEPKVIFENQEKFEQVETSYEQAGGNIHRTLDYLKRNFIGWESRFEEDPKAVTTEVMEIVNQIKNSSK